jgi:hypothetical protein
MFILRTTIDGDPGIGIKIITIPCSCAWPLSETKEKKKEKKKERKK